MITTVTGGSRVGKADHREFAATYEQMKAEHEPGTVFRFLDAMHLAHQMEICQERIGQQHV